MATIGERIRFLRKNINISQATLAEVCNVARGTISQYETDKAQPSDEIKKIMASYFNVTLDFLSGYSDNINNSIYKIDDSHLIKVPIKELINSHISSYMYVSSDKVKGGSFFFTKSPQDMISERIYKNDMLYIKDQSFLDKDGELFLVKYNCNHFVGRLFKRMNEFILVNSSLSDTFKIFDSSLELVGLIVEVSFNIK